MVFKEKFFYLGSTNYKRDCEYSYYLKYYCILCIFNISFFKGVAFIVRYILSTVNIYELKNYN